MTLLFYSLARQALDARPEIVSLSKGNSMAESSASAFDLTSKSNDMTWADMQAQTRSASTEASRGPVPATAVSVASGAEEIQTDEPPRQYRVEDDSPIDPVDGGSSVQGIHPEGLTTPIPAEDGQPKASLDVRSGPESVSTPVRSALDVTAALPSPRNDTRNPAASSAATVTELATSAASYFDVRDLSSPIGHTLLELERIKDRHTEPLRVQTAFASGPSIDPELDEDLPLHRIAGPHFAHRAPASRAALLPARRAPWQSALLPGDAELSHPTTPFKRSLHATTDSSPLTEEAPQEIPAKNSVAPFGCADFSRDARPTVVSHEIQLAPITLPLDPNAARIHERNRLPLSNSSLDAPGMIAPRLIPSAVAPQEQQPASAMASRLVDQLSSPQPSVSARNRSTSFKSYPSTPGLDEWLPSRRRSDTVTVAPAPPPVRVHIGRILIEPPPRQAMRSVRPSPLLSLGQYLRRRSRSGA